MEKYIIPYYYRFEGEYEIMAESKEEALKKTEQHCGCVLAGNNPHSTLPGEQIERCFSVHPAEEGER